MPRDGSAGLEKQPHKLKLRFRGKKVSRLDLSPPVNCHIMAAVMYYAARPVLNRYLLLYRNNSSL